MFKKIGAVLVAALMITACSSSPNTEDYEKKTEEYLKYCQEEQWDKAEKLASLDADNFAKNEKGYIKDMSYQVKDLKGKIDDAKYEDLQNKIKEAYSGKNLLKSYKIVKSEADKDSDTAVVKVDVKMLSSEKIQENIDDFMGEKNDEAEDRLADILNATDSWDDYDGLTKQAYSEIYTDEVLDQIVKLYSDSVAEYTAKFNFSIEKNKIQYVEVDDK